MSKIINEIKRKNKGIIMGGLFGAAGAFYMKVKSPQLMALGSGGWIEQIITSPPIDMGFLKILIVLIVLGAFIGYIIEDRIK